MSVIPPQARRYLLPFAFFVVLAAATRAAAALLLVPLLETLFTDGPRTTWVWVAALAAAVAAGWVLQSRLVVRAFDLGFAVVNATNNRLIDRMLSVPLGWLDTSRQDEAKRALAGSVPELFAAFVNLGGQVAISLVLPPMIGIGLLFIAWPLGVVALAATPMLFGTLLLGGRLMRKAEADFASASSEAAARTDEFARAQMVLRSAGRTGVDDSPLGRAIGTQRRTSMRMLWLTLPGTLVFVVTMQAVLIATLAVLAWMFVNGASNAAQTVALLAVMIRYFEPFTALSDLFPALESARAAWGRTRKVLAAPTLAPPGTDAVPGAATLEFRNVTFAPKGQIILNDVSFAVPAKTTTAIVGPSGAGKSTILSLIARFHDVDGGEIRVAGHDVRAYLPATLMSQLAIVFQTVQLFERGIADNIRISRPDANIEDVKAAARAAGVDEIVERLGGWDAPVGEGGSALSGGERQRVSIARALLKDAPILLLDEATSALDTGNETSIAAALRGFSSRTILIVAHRIETIAHADHILFVEGGRVVESGTREALIGMGGRFSAYWNQRRAARDWRLETTDRAKQTVR